MFIVRRDNSKCKIVKHHKIQRPLTRKDGEYQFLLGWNTDGKAIVVSVTREKLIIHMTAAEGPGDLIDDGNDIWWNQSANKGA